MTVGEVIVYDRALTNEQAGVVGAYLQSKYRVNGSYAKQDKPVAPEVIAKRPVCWLRPDQLGLRDGERVPLTTAPSNPSTPSMMVTSPSAP